MRRIRGLGRATSRDLEDVLRPFLKKINPVSLCMWPPSSPLPFWSSQQRVELPIIQGHPKGRVPPSTCTLGLPSWCSWWRTRLPMQVDVRKVGSIPGLGRSPGGGNGNPLHYSCLENPKDRRVWWATVHGVARSKTWLKQLSGHLHLGKVQEMTQIGQTRKMYSSSDQLPCPGGVTLSLDQAGL